MEEGSDFQGQIDALSKRVESHAQRVDALEEAARMDRELIAELQADGVISREHVAHLEMALRSSRTIGAAIGMLMQSRDVDEGEAFELLRAASQRANLKIRQIAEAMVTEREPAVLCSHGPGPDRLGPV
jgi:chromosome segregation ATPase